MSKLIIENKSENLERVLDFVEQFALSINLEDNITYDIKLAVDEAVSNIVRHGYVDNENHLIEIELNQKDDEINITIIDDAQEFNLLDYEVVNFDKPIDERSPGGLGIFLIKETMDQIKWQRKEGKNILSLTKNILKQENK
ncbi:MAG: ATP-binding protein [Melioribacteraceae bacterium]|nr:ATP-binding protein [Melioribacteraceae bacterium]